MKACFIVRCPVCDCDIDYDAPIGEGPQEQRTTCGACGADIVIHSDFPAPAVEPFADRFQP